MLRIAGISALLLATGCLVESEEAPSDRRICTMQMAVTGSFVQSMTPPIHEDGTPYTGCWPIGTWTFQAAPGTTDCGSPAPSVLQQYQFKVDQMLDMDGNPYQVNTYMTAPTAKHRVKVSQGGDGLCEGELNIFSTDGKEVWIIKPELYADNHLGGDGEYARYNSDQWIGDAGGGQ